MDLRLKQERLESYVCVLDRTVEDVFTSDVVVPDALEDVGEILLTDGDFCLWRLDLGSGSAEAEGEWGGSVCYRAENDGSLQHFPVKVGVRLRMHDDVIEPDLRPFASCRVTECSVQIMNTRKLRFKVRACLSLQGYALHTMELTSGVDQSPDDLFFKTEQMTATMVTDVSEQVFTAGERIALRESPEGSSLLAHHSEITADQPQRSGSRMILHGVVRSTLLYQGSDSKAPVLETIDTAFSQLLDLDNMSENDAVQCRLQLTSADMILHDGADLETDFHIVAQTLCKREYALQYLSDAYSVTDGLDLQTEAIKCVACGSLDTMTTNAEGKLTGDADGETVFAVMTQLGSVRMLQDTVSGAVTATVLLSDSDGSLHSRQAEALFEQKLPENNIVTDYRLGQPSVTKASGELQVRVPVQLACEDLKKSEARQIVSVSRIEAEGGNDQQPSLTLIPHTEASDLWETAKRYGSSIDAIRAANNLTDGEKMPEYCIIPRIRFG